MSEPVDRNVGGSRTIVTGLAVIGIAFGGFGFWSSTAPLESAAVAPGEITVENYRKTVQHREGGIVREILVRDGDEVEAGEPLAVLDDTVIRAQWSQLTARYWDGLGTRARLAAERDGAGSVDFSTFGDQDHPRIQEIMRAQSNLFHARRTMLDGQVAVLGKRIKLLEREAEAMGAERDSKIRQLVLVNEEVATVQHLVRRGLTNRPRLLALQREAARLEGERDDYSARIARVGQAIAATELEIANIAYKRLDEVAAELRQVEAEIRDLEEQLIAARDALRRTIVRSPQSGIVVGLAVHTRGAVLQPGEALMDVVPRDENLVVEARIQPDDIDRVHPGRTANIRFRTFQRSMTPPAEGEVVTVSADLLHDERTGHGYYLAQIRLDEESVADLPGELLPGMQTDVLINTGERTPLEYFLAPLTRAMDLGMRER